MRLVELEIALRNWADMPCGCGRSAEHTAMNLLHAAQGATRGLVGALEGHVWSVPALFASAPAVTAVCLAALSDDLPSQARSEFLDLLLCLVAGDGTDFGPAADGLDLSRLCQQTAGHGLWLLYEEVASGRSVEAAGTAFEILTVVETDRERLRRVRDHAGDLLPWHCHNGLCDEDPTPN